MRRSISQVEQLEFLATPMYRGGRIAAEETVGKSPAYKKLFGGNFFTFRIWKNGKETLFAIAKDTAGYLRARQILMPIIYWYSNSKKKMKYELVPNERVPLLHDWLFTNGVDDKTFVLSRNDVFVKQMKAAIFELRPNGVMHVKPECVALKMEHMKEDPTYEEMETYKSEISVKPQTRRPAEPLCKSQLFGCCPDGITSKKDWAGLNCLSDLPPPRAMSKQEQEDMNLWYQTSVSMPHR